MLAKSVGAGRLFVLDAVLTVVVVVEVILVIVVVEVVVDLDVVDELGVGVDEELTRGVVAANVGEEVEITLIEDKGVEAVEDRDLVIVVVPV